MPSLGHLSDGAVQGPQERVAEQQRPQHRGVEHVRRDQVVQELPPRLQALSSPTERQQYHE
jgi:hypothetical protein